MAFTILNALYLALLCFSAYGELLSVIDSGQTQTYIIHLRQHNRPQPELLSDEDLKSYHKSFLSDTTLDSGAPRLVYSYRHAINGFAARLTPQEVRAMAVKDGFLYAQPAEMYSLETTYTHEFLGLSTPFNGSWSGTMYGQGIIIGIIDSGILPTHPSFNDPMMPPPPAKWKGSCSSHFKCNNKLIGAKAFKNGTNPSPIDDEGHGTHVASIAAGNFVDDANVLATSKGRAAGMAPKAHVAVYKVCYEDGCDSPDILAAIDQAIKDGVDVISMSLGAPGPSSRHYEDEVAKGSLPAFKKGISPCTTAGNSGPFKDTLSHSAPWVMTVGASTTDRKIKAFVKLGDGRKFYGESGFQPLHFNSTASLPMIYPGSYPVADSEFCLNGTLDTIDVRGKVVLCRAGYIINEDKGKIVYAAGGAAMIVLNLLQSGYTTFANAHIIPAVHVNYVDSELIKDYVLSNSSATASLEFNRTNFGFRPAPALASFSSRGPVEVNGDIIKPDVLAPGVNIVGAWPFGVGPNPPPFDPNTFNYESGTSMAAPHVAGIIALIKGKHRQWSPAAIHSAIVTSASELDLDGNPIVDEETNTTAGVYSIGAGQVNPGRAMDPGLIYDLTFDDYISYLCGLGYNDTEVEMTCGEAVQCSTRRMIRPWELNYPSIGVHLNSTIKTLTVERTVKNVGRLKEVYNAKLLEPPGVSIYLSTYRLSFSRLNQLKSFNVTFTLKTSPGPYEEASGKLEWVSNSHVVKTPIAVRFY